MKTKLIFCITLFFLLYSPLLAGDIKDLCKDKWDTNYRMIEHCLKEQQKAKSEVFSYARKHGFVSGGKLRVQANSKDPYEQILYNCMRKWKNSKHGTYNYRMVNHCLEKQLESYNKLRE